MVGKIGSELRKRYQIVFLAALRYVRKVSERIVALHVWVNTTSRISDAWQAFGVGFPSLSCGQQVPNDIVLGNCAAHRVVVGDDLACSHHEIVAD